MHRFFALAFVSTFTACGIDANGIGGAAEAFDDGVDPVDSSLPIANDSAAIVAPDAPPDSDALADAGSDSPLPGCSVESYGGHEYLLCELDASWDQARTNCQLAGYDLVVLGDRPEHDWLVGRLQTKSKSQFHIGLSDRDKEGTFVWVDGASMGFASWAFFEPNNLWFSEDCVVLDKDGEWNDVSCGDGPRDGFVCESP